MAFGRARPASDGRTWQERGAHQRHVADAARALPRERSGAGPRGALAVATIVWLATVVWLALTLPERVPTHWTSGSVPDGWSSREGALAFSVLLPLVTIFPLLWLSRLALVWPDGINLPEPAKRWWLDTPERLVRFERLLREDLMLIVASTLLLFAAADVVIGVAAHRPGGMAPGAAFPAILVGYLAAIGAVVIRMLVGGRYRATGP